MISDKPSSIKKLILAVFLSSLIMGGATGGVVGAYVASSISGRAIDLSQLLKPSPLAKDDDNNANTNAPVPSDGEPSKVQPVSEDMSLSEMVKKVSPAVVSIVITKEVSQAPVSDFFSFNPFNFDFNEYDSGGNANTPKEKKQVGSGSGFLISSDGLVVTNRHVVEDATATYTVVLADGSKHDAVVLARDTVIDLALIKIEGKNYPTVQLGDSDKLELGQTVVAIGNALGEFSNSVTRGIVSGINRKITASGALSGSEVIDHAIQTDAAINPGNSGGPLLTLDGKVVGVNTAVSQQGQSVGFAIPINIAKQSIESVQKTGRIVRPYLGVRYVIINEAMAKENQLPFSYGALVSRGTNAAQLAVIPGSPADKAGIVENDIILEADGVKVDEDHTLVSAIIKKKVGDKINFKIYHKGDTKTVTVTLAEMPST